jgi:hypothetical protein
VLALLNRPLKESWNILQKTGKDRSGEPSLLPYTLNIKKAYWATSKYTGDLHHMSG